MAQCYSGILCMENDAISGCKDMEVGSIIRYPEMMDVSCLNKNPWLFSRWKGTCFPLQVAVTFFFFQLVVVTVCACVCVCIGSYNRRSNWCLTIWFWVLDLALLSVQPQASEFITFGFNYLTQKNEENVNTYS